MAAIHYYKKKKKQKVRVLPTPTAVNAVLFMKSSSLADFCAVVFCDFFDNKLHSVKTEAFVRKANLLSRIPDKY